MERTKDMTMYEELVKKLRRCGKGLCTEDCPDWTKENLYHTCQDELVLEAADAIEELSNPRWISVTEALPEEWKSVLTYQPYKNDREKPLIRVSWYIGVGIWRECEQANTLELPVTHWMPLPPAPEPPKEE